MTQPHALTVGFDTVERTMQLPNRTQIARSVVELAQQLARSTVHSIGRVLPWLNGAHEAREAMEDIFARHFERQLEDELALCLHCGSVRVNYCERDERTGISLDGYFEVTSEAGYLCADCGAFEESVIQLGVEEGI